MILSNAAVKVVASHAPVNVIVQQAVPDRRLIIYGCCLICCSVDKIARHNSIVRCEHIVPSPLRSAVGLSHLPRPTDLARRTHNGWMVRIDTEGCLSSMQYSRHHP